MREPLIDVIMLVHDNAKWADLSVRSVEHFTKNPFRLWIVDSASEEQATKKFLEDCEARGHAVIHLHQNQSFSNGVNIGVAAGTAKFVCVLNDDVVVTEGWDSQMVQEASAEFTGLVGARSNNAAGAQGDPTATEVPYLVFTCVMLRRDIWNKALPLDEVTFDGFSSEDLDFSWRILKSGMKLVVSQANVFHAGSRTLIDTMKKKGLRPEEIGAALAKNNEKYNARLVDKWGKDWVKDHVKTKPKMLLATYHAEEHTRVEFYKNAMVLLQGKVPFTHYASTREHIHVARENVARFAMRHDYDIVFQFDDDATFPPDIVARLLARLNEGHGHDVVCALAYQRGPPFLPCAFELNPEDPEKLHASPIEGIEHTGLRKVDVSGFHVSAIRVSAFRKLAAYREKDKIAKDAKGEPAEKYPDGIKPFYGGFDNKIGEDFALCHNLRKVGIDVYVDTDLCDLVGHIGSPTVVNSQHRKSWRAQGGQ